MNKIYIIYFLISFFCYSKSDEVGYIQFKIPQKYNLSSTLNNRDLIYRKGIVSNYSHAIPIPDKNIKDELKNEPFLSLLNLLGQTKQAALKRDLQLYSDFYEKKSFDFLKDGVSKIPKGQDALFDKGSKLSSVYPILCIFENDDCINILNEVFYDGNPIGNKRWTALKKNKNIYKIFIQKDPDPELIAILHYFNDVNYKDFLSNVIFFNNLPN